MNEILTAYTLSECMEVMARRAFELERAGGKNLIFCEDRLTLVAERALLAQTGGSFFSSVSTFARFLKTEARAISKQGSVMAVGEVMTRLQREGALQCFTSTYGVGKNARCIYETLAQFSASKITPQTLRDSLEMLADDTLKKNHADHMLTKKIDDLSKIYEGYLEFLAEKAFLDESKYLTLLPSRIREEGLLKGYNVFFLCYNSFTAQAKETICAALETADNVIGIFCAGKEDIYTNRAVRDFTEACRDGNFAKPIIRDMGAALGGEAEILRKSLFNPTCKMVDYTTKNVRVFEARSKNAEAEYVAVKIRREMAERGVERYRDFAVLVPDVASYSLALKKAFEEFKIPYFIDEKKSLKRHPLSRFLLDCFRTVCENFAPSAVQALCSNVFFGESDEYRNYLLKFANYRGGAKREIKNISAVTDVYDLAVLESGRERVLKATSAIKAAKCGKEFCAAIDNILKDFDVEGRLKTLETESLDLSQKGYLSQIHRALKGVLTEAEQLTGGKEMSAAEFAAVLQDGLDATEISLIPLKADAVFIGNITDSRIEKVRVLFAMGMTDEVPRSAVDTAIVSDKEIKRLATLETILEPTVAEVNLRARESVCLNLCTFLDRLYLSYPLGADGSEPSLSEIFRYVDSTFGKMEKGKRKPVPRKKGYEPNDFIFRCSAPTPALRQLLLEESEYRAEKKDVRFEYSSLLTALNALDAPGKEKYLSERRGQVRVKDGKLLFFNEFGKISPTALEEYFACPFRHFAGKGLKLTEREEAAVQAMDTGNFVHDLLKKTMKKAAAIDGEKNALLKEAENATDEAAAQRAAELAAQINTEERVRAYAQEEGEKMLGTSLYAMQQDTDSGAYFTQKLLKEAVDVAMAAYVQIKNSAFHIEATEKTIDGELIRGQVDRVDSSEEYVRVIDYKTGRIDDSAGAYYTGKKLQMQLYMHEVQGDRIPAAVLYFPAALDFAAEDEGRFRMKGFLNKSEKALLCGDKNLTKDKKSEYFPAALENSSRTTRVMEEGKFKDFIEYSVHVSRQACKELKGGFIAATPYDNECKYCKFGGMCGYSKDINAPRKEERIEPSTIANIAKKERGEE